MNINIINIIIPPYKKGFNIISVKVKSFAKPECDS